ncbi:hypothetical protein GCM10007086_29220 [Photobacterium aphoticum]|nr:hypothetical protein GCM10007086_29220 [Photobacterium aphoticum]
MHVDFYSGFRLTFFLLDIIAWYNVIGCSAVYVHVSIYVFFILHASCLVDNKVVNKDVEK